MNKEIIYEYVNTGKGYRYQDQGDAKDQSERNRDADG